MVETFHAAIADSVASVEDVVERTIGAVPDRVVELMRDPTGRDPITWVDGFRAAATEGVLVDVSDWDIDADDLNLVPMAERSLRWLAIWTVLLSCAEAQAQAEAMARRVWETLQHGQIDVMLAARSLGRPLSAEARRGPPKALFAAARRRKAGG